MLRGLRLRHDSGELTADLLEAPDDFRFNLESSLDPTALRGIVSPEVARFLGEWEWRRPPSRATRVPRPKPRSQRRGQETAPWHFNARASAAPG